MRILGLSIAIHAGNVMICNQSNEPLCGISPDVADELAKQLINAASMIRNGKKIIDLPDSAIKSKLVE